MSLRELAAAAIRCLRELEAVAAHAADDLAEFARVLARLVSAALRILRSLMTVVRIVVSGISLSAKLLARIVEMTLGELPRVFSAASFHRHRQEYRRDHRFVEREIRRRDREQEWAAAQQERAQGRRAQSPPPPPPPPPRYPLRRRFPPGRHSDPDEPSTSSSDSTSSDDYLSAASIVQPYIASRGGENPIFTMHLEETIMRYEPGKSSMSDAAPDWGLKCPRWEIRDIAMEIQNEVERRKRTRILESEGAMLDQANRAKALIPADPQNSSLTRRHYFPNASPYQLRSRSFASDSGEKFEAGVPFMGESVTATFQKNPGDRVEADEAIAQIETDKVTIDVSSPEAGVLEKYIASEGDTATPGTRVAIVPRSEAPAETHVAPSEEATPKESAPSKVEEKSPKEEPPRKEAPKPTPSKTSPIEPQLPPEERERPVPMPRLRKRIANFLKDCADIRPQAD